VNNRSSNAEGGEGRHTILVTRSGYCLASVSRKLSNSSRVRKALKKGSSAALWHNKRAGNINIVRRDRRNKLVVISNK
jgi:hypothetical protein